MRPGKPRGNGRKHEAAASGVAIALVIWLSVASAGLVASQSRLSEASEHARVEKPNDIGLAFDRQTPRTDDRNDHGLDRLREIRQTVAAAMSPADRLDAATARPPTGPKPTMTIEERDAALRVENRRRRRLARLEVAHLLGQGRAMRLWLQDWVLGNVGALEDVVDETGIDVERLIARATRRPVPAQGGPLQVAAPDRIHASISSNDPMSWDIQRLVILQRVARSLPLAPPLDRFRVTSPFGKRRDPFTDTWAYHSGIDFGAPRHAEVLATAPGRVILAGPLGPYGNTVEIAHGMGIVTRYGHLKSLAVEVGQSVSFRTPVGVIGTTGRSTSRHLHYEIRIDDQVLDPAKFLEAGRLMAGNVDAAAGEASGDATATPPQRTECRPRSTRTRLACGPIGPSSSASEYMTSLPTSRSSNASSSTTMRWKYTWRRPGVSMKP
jgi:hypothetical protein